MFSVTWRGSRETERAGLVFGPGESRLFEAREDIPSEIQSDPGFVIIEVGEGDGERARGTIPRFTEVPRPEDSD
jgi:hypothetical protein